jgi:hypothetical protein
MSERVHNMQCQLSFLFHENIICDVKIVLRFRVTGYRYDALYLGTACHVLRSWLIIFLFWVRFLLCYEAEASYYQDVYHFILLTLLDSCTDKFHSFDCLHIPSCNQTDYRRYDCPSFHDALYVTKLRKMWTACSCNTLSLVGLLETMSSERVQRFGVYKPGYNTVRELWYSWTKLPRTNHNEVAVMTLLVMRKPWLERNASTFDRKSATLQQVLQVDACGVLTRHGFWVIRLLILWRWL